MDLLVGGEGEITATTGFVTSLSGSDGVSDPEGSANDNSCTPASVGSAGKDDGSDGWPAAVVVGATEMKVICANVPQLPALSVSGWLSNWLLRRLFRCLRCFLKQSMQSECGFEFQPAEPSV